MINHLSLVQPSIKSHLVSHSEHHHTLVIEPLLSGYGHTLGNSLRRVLLSSVPGFAVTKIRINDITHEYQPISGVVEDAMDVVLNLKMLRTKILTDDEKVTITLTKEEEGEVRGSDFSTNGKVQIVNPDLYVCYLSKGAKLTIELEISRGVGYLTIEEIDLTGSTDPHEILVDAIFTPVTNVSLHIEKVRVGDKTDYDKLEITFDTDGSITAKDTVDFVLDVMIDIFSKINSAFQAGPEVLPVNQTVQISTSKTATADEDVKLPAKIKGILEKNGISSNSQLKEKISEVSEYSGITAKQMQTIQEYVDSLV